MFRVVQGVAVAFDASRWFYGEHAKLPVRVRDWSSEDEERKIEWFNLLFPAAHSHPAFPIRPMPASDSDSDASGPDLLALGTVSPNSFRRDSLLRGRIDNVNPCRDGVASLKIKDDTGALWIQLRGNWAEEAIRTFNQIGKPITVGGQGGSIKATKDKHGNHVTNDRGWKTYQIVYTEGIQGFWGTEGRGFAFKGKSPFSRSRTEY